MRSHGRVLMVLAGGALAAALTAEPAAASLLVDAATGGVPTGVNYVNFDNLPLGSAGGVASGPSGSVTVAFSGGAQAVQGSASGQYAAPYLSGGNGTDFGNPVNGQDTTTYLTSGVGSATLTFAGPERYVGLLWGSVDLYNTLSFYNGTTLLGSVTGSGVDASASGNQGASGTYYVNINSTLPFDRVVASSSAYAFEFDNLAYNSSETQVPAPASWTVMLAGIAALGFLFARRRV